MREEALVYLPLPLSRLLMCYALSTPPVVQDKEQRPHIKPAHHVDVPPRPAETGNAIRHEGEITTMTTTRKKRKLILTREVVGGEEGEAHSEVVRRITVMTKKSQRRRTGDRRRSLRQEALVRARSSLNSRFQAMKNRIDTAIRHTTRKWCINDSAGIGKFRLSPHTIAQCCTAVQRKVSRYLCCSCATWQLQQGYRAYE